VEWRAEDTGKSESRPVIGRIEALLRRESGLTSSWSLVTRELAEPAKERIANERGLRRVCTLRQSTDVSVPGQQAASEYRQVLAANRCGIGSVRAALRNGLSRMKGNFHVRFLGEGAAVTPRPYPTLSRERRARLCRRRCCALLWRPSGWPELTEI
jgi:hypothetical protein